MSSDWFPVVDALYERLSDELGEAGVEADQKRAEAAREEKQRRRPEVLRELERLNRRELERGVVVFETDLPEEPGSLIVCVSCKAELSLGPHRPGGICGCGTLYHGEKRGVAGRIEFAVESYPID
jgi:hypothetical protein